MTAAIPFQVAEVAPPEACKFVPPWCDEDLEVAGDLHGGEVSVKNYSFYGSANADSFGVTIMQSRTLHP